MILRKFDQNHDEKGRFTFSDNPQGPTGNPRGRPLLDANPKTRLLEGTSPQFGREASQIGGGIGGGIAGQIAGKLGGAALGGAIGSLAGPEGTIIGARWGASFGPIVGSLIGDYVGSRIGTALFDLKQGMDGHPVGAQPVKTGEFTPRDWAGEAGATAAGWGAYSAASRFGGETAGSSVGRGLGEGAGMFLPGGPSLWGTIGQTVGGAAGVELPSAAGDIAGYAGGVKAYDAARGGAGAPAGAAVGRALGAARVAERSVGKSLFDSPPKSYDGSWGSMTTQAPAHLFGPKAWAKIKNTPFGHYVMDRVKTVAERMDDAAEQHGIETKPMPKKTTQQIFEQPAERFAQQGSQNLFENQQAQAQAVMAPPGSPKGGPQGGGGGASPSPGGSPPGGAPSAPPPPGGIAKLFTLRSLFRFPNDAVARDAYRTGGTANVNFLRRMQESDRKSRNFQLRLAMNQPKVENLAQKPDEDEQMYQARMQRVMAASVANSEQTRPQLFHAGPVGSPNPISQAQRTLYTVKLRKSAKNAENSTREPDTDWRITTEIAKDLSLKQGLVYGWASVIEKGGETITDHQGDRISSDELVKAAHDYMTNERHGGVLHDEIGHDIGHIVESVVFTKELQKHLGVDLGKVGWLIGYKITDDRVKMMVKSGVLKAFSIGGKGRREEVLDAA